MNVLLIIQLVVSLALNVALAGTTLWAAIHATITPNRAFEAFTRWPKTNWMIILWVAVIFTLSEGVRSLIALLSMLGINVTWLAPIGFLGLGNFFGLLMFAIPGVYFASEYPAIKRFKQLEKGRGQWQQRPGKPRGPRDW